MYNAQNRGREGLLTSSAGHLTECGEELREGAAAALVPSASGVLQVDSLVLPGELGLAVEVDRRNLVHGHVRYGA